MKKVKFAIIYLTIALFIKFLNNFLTNKLNIKSLKILSFNANKFNRAFESLNVILKPIKPLIFYIKNPNKIYEFYKLVNHYKFNIILLQEGLNLGNLYILNNFFFENRFLIFAHKNYPFTKLYLNTIITPNINLKPKTIKFKTSFKPQGLQIVQFESFNSSFLLINLHLISKYNFKYYKTIKKSLKKLTNTILNYNLKFHNIIIAGDFNVDFTKPNTLYKLEFLKTLKNNNFTILKSKFYTYKNKYKGKHSTLDYFIIKLQKKFKYKFKTINNSLISDHKPLYLKIECK